MATYTARVYQYVQHCYEVEVDADSPGEAARLIAGNDGNDSDDVHWSGYGEALWEMTLPYSDIVIDDDDRTCYYDGKGQATSTLSICN